MGIKFGQDNPNTKIQHTALYPLAIIGLFGVLKRSRQNVPAPSQKKKNSLKPVLCEKSFNIPILSA